MIRIGALPKEPYWIDLLYGVRVRVRPLTTAVASAARYAALDRVDDLARGLEDLREAGMASPDAPDLSRPAVRRGLLDAYYLVELGRAGIVAWEGVIAAESDEPAPVTSETVADLLSLPDQARTFEVRYHQPLGVVAAEKKGCGPSPNGTSAEGPTTATDAGGPDRPAPTADA